MKAIEFKTSSEHTVYVEVADDPEIVGSKAGGQIARGKADVIIRELQDVGDTIADVCRSLESQVTAALGKTKPSELTLEFGVKLSGEAGIPLVTKGSAEGTFKITAKWIFKKDSKGASTNV